MRELLERKERMSCRGIVGGSFFVGDGKRGSCVICLNQCIDIAAILLYNITNQLVFGKEEVMTKQEIKSTQTKQAILKAAEEEFSEKGIYGARVDEIAAKAKD